MSIEREWKFYPPSGSWFRLPRRDGTEMTIDVVWRDAAEADIVMDGESKTIPRQELDDLYMQATFVSLPVREIRTGMGKNGRPTHPFSNY